MLKIKDSAWHGGIQKALNINAHPLLLRAASRRSPDTCGTVIRHLLFGKEAQFSENGGGGGGVRSKYGLLLPTYPTHANTHPRV